MGGRLLPPTADSRSRLRHVRVKGGLSPHEVCTAVILSRSCPLWVNSGHRDDYCECHTGGAVATALGQTVTSSLLRHWTMIGTDSVFRPV